MVQNARRSRELIPGARRLGWRPENWITLLVVVDKGIERNLRDCEGPPRWNRVNRFLENVHLGSCLTDP